MTSGVEKTRNQLLMRLSSEDHEQLRPHLEPVSFSFKQTIFGQGKKIGHVYFPESGVVSMVKDLDQGGPIEIATIGYEGMVGLPAVLGTATSSLHAFCQVPGRALRLKAEVALAQRRRGGQFAELMMRYANATIAMLEQSAACNRAHALEERMCRWLLMTHDRVGEDSFPLTQEFLAHMLGVRRPTVNLAGRSVQRAGLIRYTRGRITIVDRKGLEETSCECYFHIRDEFTRSLGGVRKEHKHKR